MIVCFTVNNRPAYLRRALESWSKVRGIRFAHLIFCCEPGCAEAVAVCRSADFAASALTILNSERQGVLSNPWRAFETGFAHAAERGTDFVILAEDDLIVSPDTLEYFAFCQRYADDPDVLGATASQLREQPGGLAGVTTADWPDKPAFWVWGTWADRWQALLRDSWDKTYEENGGGPLQRGWDWKIRNLYMVRDGMTMVAPSLSRSQHIGRYGGTHATPAQFASLQSRCFAGPEVPPQDYQEVALWRTTRASS